MVKIYFTLLIIIALLFFVSFSGLIIQKVSAATDAVQVNLSVTAPSGGGSGPTSVPGCTDPLATNYNPAATESNGSCQYPLPETVPNVSGFSATLDGQNVRLTWQNPSFPAFAAVRIVRQTNVIPTGPTDGSLIYDGAGVETLDSNVAHNTRYYYVAFVRNASGVYSSGALASISIPPEETEEPPPGDEPPPDDQLPPGDDAGDGSEGGDGSGGNGDPFANLPQIVATDPLTRLLKLGDFVFYQPGERQQFFGGGEDVSIVGWKPLSIAIAAEKLPEALKVIGLTIIDPRTNRPLGSYLLKATADGANYTASLGNVFPNGIYPLFISIINFQNQTIKRLAGRLVVSSGVPSTPIERAMATTQRVLTPVAITVGLASGLAQGLALADRVGSAYDLYLIMLHGWSLLLRILGLRRKAPPWGVVYDAVTKRPLDPAYVIIRQGDEDKGTAITDLDGRYGFFLPADTYKIIANKTHYQFPSKKLVGRTNDELYGNLYFGEPFATASGEVINRNIPLDPIAFDWNEFAKQARGFFILHSRRQARRRRIFNGFYAIGFGLGAYNFIFHPGTLAIVILVLYLATFLARYIKRRAFGQALTVKRLTGEPVPFAIIRAFVPDVNQEVKAVVADALGRFFLLTPPGRYYVTVDEKLPDETYKRIYQSPPADLKNGVLTNDLVV